MKKLIFAILACLVVCTQINAKEEVKFKNPIFYNKMVPDEGGPDLFLTPTWAKYDMFENGIAEGPCELLANEESYIIITCTIRYPNGDVDVYKYKYEALYDCATLKDLEQPIPNDDGLCSIKEYSYDLKTNRIDGWSFFTVQKTK